MESAVWYAVTDWVLGTGDSTITKKAKVGIKFKAINCRQTDKRAPKRVWMGWGSCEMSQSANVRDCVESCQ